MQEAVAARTPAHLWIVGILSLLWNSFGAYDYTMTRMRNMEYLGSMGIDPNIVLEYIDTMPIWSQFGWGLGVWGSLLGSVLLLMRSRYAVHAFAASVIGALLSLGWQMIGSTPPAEMSQGAMKYMPILIIVLIAAQLWYAWRQSQRGILR